MANPLMAFALIKRLQSDWRNVVYSLEGSENIQGAPSSPLFNLRREEARAARALMRLQDVYALSIKELARGRFRTTSGAHPDLYRPRQDFVLSADDCFHIGKVAYDKEDYYHSIPWMEEAVRLFRISYGNWNTEDEGSLEEALDHLAFSYFMAGNISHALKLSQEFLHYDPGNERMARNVLKYEKLLRKDQEEGKGKNMLQRPNVTHLETRDAYEELCQRLGSQ
ncbi:Prolyl 4-hydroxylase subunit alpha-3, partial [Ophiophagus hannah]